MVKTVGVTHTKCRIGDKMNARVVKLSDLHIGGKTFREDLLKHAVNYIKNNKYTYWIGLGDYVEMGTRSSPGTSLFDLRLRNEEQWDMVEEYLHPIRKKCLGLHRGNHDLRVDTNVGINMTRNLCKYLHIPYLTDAAFHSLEINGKIWKIFTTHGRSGATTERGKETAIKRLKESHGGADIYAMGHVHKLKFFEDWHFVVDENPVSGDQSIRKESNGYYLFAGHFMDYIGSYAQQMLLPPEPAGYPILTFRPNDTFSCELVWGHDMEHPEMVEVAGCTV